MKYIHKFEKFLSAGLLAVMTIVTFAAAVNRFTFKFAMPWSEELVKFLLMWMTMVGAAMGVGMNEHVGIDIFVGRLPHGLQHVVSQLMHAVGMFFSALFLYIGVQMVQKQYMQKSTALEVSMGIVYACVAVGAVLMFIEFAYKFYCGFKRAEATNEGGDAL